MSSVMKVLLGENPECELDQPVPSKAGLQTVLEVLQIQMKFWPCLEIFCAKLQSQWETFISENKSEQFVTITSFLNVLFSQCLFAIP